MVESGSLEEACGLIVAGLRSRKSVIEWAIGARVRDAVPHPVEGRDPGYEAGLLQAISSLVHYSLDALERGPGGSGQIPLAAIAQARRAARLGVSLGTVQRRYFAGHRALGDFVTREIQDSGFSNDVQVINHLRRTQEALLEDLTAAIEREYDQERALIEENEMGMSELDRSEQIYKLLAAGRVDPEAIRSLGYEPDAWHLGIVAAGTGAARALRDLKAGLGCEMLSITHGKSVLAWLGAQRQIKITDIERVVAHIKMADVSFAVGEPGIGIEGLRLTHRQAQEARGVAVYMPRPLTWYAENRLLAAGLRNATLARSLKKAYMVPLRGQSDGGAALRKTLRAYIDTECNTTSAASAAGVNRHTAASHIEKAEQLMGGTIGACITELDIALRLEELEDLRPHLGQAQSDD